MTENISYRKCTCDICGKVAKTPISGSLLPKEWEHFTIGKKEYDVCLDCFVKVDMAIEDLKENKKPEKTNISNCCIYNNEKQDWDFCK